MKAMRKINPALVLLLLAAGPAAAYVPLSPARTWDCPPDYTVDNRGLSSVTDADGGVTRTVNAVISSAAWNGAGSANVVSAHSGSVASFSLGDGVPMLNFYDPLSACIGSCLAATFTGYFSERTTGSGSWSIDDADIVTNRTGYNWTSQGEDPGGAGCSSEIFVEGVMVHEVGHGLGLGHTGVAGATMYASVSYCNNTPATTEADDESGIVSLYGAAPCTGCDDYTNYLTGTGSTQYQPCGTYYYSGVNGIHNGYLRGPAGTDFDLYLWRWNGSSWVQVASALSVSSNENISYNGVAGWYLWGVYSYSGAGTYHFWLDRP
jgi:hypothetical protein